MKLSGGKRAGAGRPTLVKKESGVFLRLSESVIYNLNKFSRLTGATKADLAELSIDKYLSRENGDFIYCPKCGEPVVFLPTAPCCNGIADCKCDNCGKEFKYNDATCEIIQNNML